ncbi:hypothetical protein BH09BAC2_BH09BAC2_23700 [soil metagenome]
MFKYILKQPFWVNMIIAVALIFIILFIFLSSLSWFTNHGAYLQVPAVKGRNVSDAVKLLEAKGFEVVIVDSVFTDSVPKYSVIKQLPEPNATVKVNRTVFLTINRATPPDVDMPKLEGLSLRFAKDILLRNHLQLGDTTNRPDFMRGSVLEQIYNNERISAGTKIPWSSKIDLVIGSGLQETRIAVPDLVGLTFAEAKAIIDVKGITLASVIPMEDITDKENAFVYKQNPTTTDQDGNVLFIQGGQTMDVWLTRTPVNIDSVRRSRIKIKPPVIEPSNDSL